ncbi:hypothetical protein A2G94_03295 [Francisella endosymbiont of Ornithodoros moubata]|nr:hypothetical protein A2G94_03295 [Francisella endosymbiont of Ornithodoros moubata]
MLKQLLLKYLQLKMLKIEVLQTLFIMLLPWALKMVVWVAVIAFLLIIGGSFDVLSSDKSN